MNTKEIIYISEHSYEGCGTMEFDYSAQLPDDTVVDLVTDTNGGKRWQDVAQEIAETRFPNHEIRWA